jgi:hypothetical protein
MPGCQHRNSVTEEGGMKTGRTWTEDGKRRQSLQLLFINSTVIRIEADQPLEKGENPMHRACYPFVKMSK